MRKEGKFIGKVLIEHDHSDCKRFTVRKRLGYISTKGKIINLLPDWNTDGASFPTRILGCPFAGCYLEAALIHDALYGAQLITRKEADDLMLEAMKAKGVSFYLRWKIYTGVRVGGWVAWDNVTDRKREYFRKYVYVTNG